MLRSSAHPCCWQHFGEWGWIMVINAACRKGFYRWDCEKGQCYLCLVQWYTLHVAAGAPQKRPGYTGHKRLRNSAMYGSGLSWDKLFLTFLLQPVSNLIANVCLDCTLTFMNQTMLSATLQVAHAPEPDIPHPLLPAAPPGILRLLWPRNMKGHTTFMGSGKIHIWESTFSLPGASPWLCKLKLCSLSAEAPHKKKIVSHKLLQKCTLHVNCKINSLNSFHWAQRQKENEPTAVDYFCWIGFNHLYWCPSFFSWLPSLKTPIANFIWVPKNRDIHNLAVFVSQFSSPFPPCTSDQTYFKICKTSIQWLCMERNLGTSVSFFYLYHS